MKKMWLNNRLKRAFIAMVATVLLGFISSCSNDDDDDNNGGGSGTSHKVVFKAQASPGSNISNAAYGYDANITQATGLSGTSWSSPEITVPAGAVMVNGGVVGTGANATSTLKVQVFVDGELKKEATASGTVLSATASYSF
ncbi:hypothetical protein CEY12_20070 [Chryseobacterium sp. T16E-39]|uniref:hypothetical protein n=1 Tax=Chryseobacterium sp. T16E-39 TaxID=2015076 RepID=UPI000B5B109D|nr:hypothetical protein [Chryseobacterium sp. T16E-39]ASK32241.1 hypothetical protein CEY12_20070 [Chryseobacterium sp. T16E-39]